MFLEFIKEVLATEQTEYDIKKVTLIIEEKKRIMALLTKQARILLHKEVQ